MRPTTTQHDILLSLPPAAVTAFRSDSSMIRSGIFACTDPPDRELGSGGGTVHLLVEGWREWTGGGPFEAWLGERRKIIIHAGGRSRRAPAYAPQGKIFTPMPVWRWDWGQSLTQTLFDLQLRVLERISDHAPPDTRVIVSSGDVLIQGENDLPPLPDADVVCLGLWGSAELASRFGVFFSTRDCPDQLDFVLQKPTPAEIRERARTHLFLVDSGIWLLSRRAVNLLLRKCGWLSGEGRFAGDMPGCFDLYTTLGMALGLNPSVPDPETLGLTAAAVAVPEGEFYHFGTTGDMISANVRLQNRVLNQAHSGHVAYREHPAVFTQNSCVHLGLTTANDTIWIENSCIADTWRLTKHHMITGVPANTWSLQLRDGHCVDMVPVEESAWCFRPYGFADTFRGAVGGGACCWLGGTVCEWLQARGLTLADLGLPPDTDVHDAPLFPLLSELTAADGELLQWLLDAESATDFQVADCREQSEVSLPLLNHPPPAAAVPVPPVPVHSSGVTDFRSRYLASERLSANELNSRANVARIRAQRDAFRREILPTMAARGKESIFYRLDLRELAGDFSRWGLPVPETGALPDDPLTGARAALFVSEVHRLNGDSTWETDGRIGFDTLRDAIVRTLAATPVRPRNSVLSDQIVWARSPVRLDLAGGWTDTPPYCCQHGGCVVNLAVDLNGQPPVQVFAKPCSRPLIIIRSIDLGAEVTVSEFAELRGFTQVGDPFAIPKAALAIAGFLPEFSACPQPTLVDQLLHAGGGIELTLLAAVPKGSGLGTSSILAATLLGALSEMLDLGWDRQEIMRRTLALEQMLTTGGGWQDQAGGILPGLKMVESLPGLSQNPLTVRWLSTDMLETMMNRELLLYYTGITRVAKNILQEIVRGMFLNDGTCLAVLSEIKAHARRTYERIQLRDREGLGSALDRSWQLNCALDAGTDPPEIRDLLTRLRPWRPAVKLLGAGGGGYMLIAARSAADATAIRDELSEKPANERSRFVAMSISTSGMQITRS